MQRSIFVRSVLVAFGVVLSMTAASARAHGSCVNACGEFSLAGLCWCDESCTSYGDCCSDYVAACRNCEMDARTWGTEARLQARPATPTLNRTFPDVGVSADGTAMALWQFRGGPSATGLHASRFVAGAWSARTDLASGSGTTTTTRGNAARLAAGAAGHAFATFPNNEMAFFAPGSGWTTLASSMFPATRTPLDRAVDESGNALLLYHNGLNLILRRRGVWLGLWGVERVLGPANPDADLAVNAGGDHAVIYTPSYGYVVARYPVFGAWSAARVSSSGGRSGRVGVADDGTVLSAWLDVDNSVRTSRVTAAGATAPHILASYGSEAVDRLRLAVNGAGRAIASWLHSVPAPNYFEIVAAVYTPGSGWSAPSVVVPTALPTLGGTPQQDVTIDACGAGLLVHDDRRYESHAYRYTPSSGWGARHTFHPALDLRIAGAANGSATAVWDNDQNEVMAARFE